IYFPPEEPIRALLSKDYAKERLKLIDWKKNNPDIRPGDPYAFEGKTNPFLNLLTNWSNVRTNYLETGGRASAQARTALVPGAAASNAPGLKTGDRDAPEEVVPAAGADARGPLESFFLGTTSIQAADEKGWAISVTPSGGWQPACIAGNTGIGMSQRMQNFVLDPAENPFNVLAPGKRPRVTLTPTLALKDGKLFLCFRARR